MEALNITDQNFAGTFANTMIVRATLDMDTVEKGCIYVIDGIKKSYSIPRLDVSNFVQARAATPQSQGAILVDRTVLTPQDYMVYLEFNPRDYEQHWFSYQLNKNLLDETLPQTAESFTVYQLLRRLGEWNERALWQSRLTYNPLNPGYVTAVSKGAPASAQQYQYFDGLAVKFLNDATVLKVAGAVPVAGITFSSTSTLYTPFESLLALIPEPLLFKYGKAGTKFHVGSAVKLNYESFLTGTGFKNNDTTEKSIDRYKGYEVEVLQGMPADFIVFCVSRPDIDSNIFLGLNSTDDENNVQLQRLQANSELFFIKLLLKADPNSGYGDQMAIYSGSLLA